MQATRKGPANLSPTKSRGVSPPVLRGGRAELRRDMSPSESLLPRTSLKLSLRNGGGLRLWRFLLRTGDARRRFEAKPAGATWTATPGDCRGPEARGRLGLATGGGKAPEVSWVGAHKLHDSNYSASPSFGVSFPLLPAGQAAVVMSKATDCFPCAEQPGVHFPFKPSPFST